MPEHGLTTGEATARLCGIVRSLHHYGDPPDPRLRADVDADVQAVVDAAYTLADTLRARHVREAVEGASDEVIQALAIKLDCLLYPGDEPEARAALLDALGGTDTTRGTDEPIS